jgi:hypothetical protein
VSQLNLIIEAGHHDRIGCPVNVIVDGAQLDESDKLCVNFLDAQGKVRACVPAQCEEAGGKVTATFLVDRLQRGQSVQAVLMSGADTQGCSPSGDDIALRHEQGNKVDVVMPDGLFTSYVYHAQNVRPFLYPVIGPFGVPLTRELEGDPKQGFDHPHHRSLYVAHGDVNGADCWSEGKEHGWVRHREFKKLASGAVFADIVALNEWQDKDGKKVLEQTTYLRFYNLPKSHRLIDKRVVFHATEGDVKFGDTKEGGICSLRVNPTMNVSRFGRMENSYGGVNERECWGKRAHWIDYAGPVEGNWAGVAMFDHPTSFRHPTYWHARDYGLCTANPFGLSDFLGKGHDGSHVLPKGETLTFVYRIYIHPGDTAEGKVGERYHDFVSPPRVREQ